ncbi:MAG: hypothetical protein ACRC0G_06095 [Fusobacteriaceae bacterium]
MKVLNFTVHKLTKDQILGGGIEPSDYVKEQISLYTNVLSTPDASDLKWRAKKLVNLMFSSCETIKEDLFNHDSDKEICVMIGSGPPAMTHFLVIAMKEEGIIPCFSHSKRECVETNNEDGTVSKNYVFKHESFYTV